jgi:hypothetical protein
MENRETLQSRITEVLLISGAVTTFLFHTHIFGGADWIQSLKISCAAFFAIATFGAIFHPKGALFSSALLLTPFILIGVGLYLGSWQSGGDPSSFGSEMLYVSIAGTAGATLGVALKWVLKRK